MTAYKVLGNDILEFMLLFVASEIAVLLKLVSINRHFKNLLDPDQKRLWRLIRDVRIAWEISEKVKKMHEKSTRMRFDWTVHITDDTPVEWPRVLNQCPVDKIFFVAGRLARRMTPEVVNRVKRLPKLTLCETPSAYLQSIYRTVDRLEECTFLKETFDAKHLCYYTGMSIRHWDSGESEWPQLEEVIMIVNDLYKDIPMGSLNTKVVQLHVTSTAGMLNAYSLNVMLFKNLKEIRFSLRSPIRTTQFRTIRNANLQYLEYVGIVSIEEDVLEWCTTEVLPWSSRKLSTIEFALYQTDTTEPVDWEAALKLATKPIANTVILQYLEHSNVDVYSIATEALAAPLEPQMEAAQAYFRAMADRRCDIYKHSVDLRDATHINLLEKKFDEMRSASLFQ